jgi:hypothetical protein
MANWAYTPNVKTFRDTIIPTHKPNPLPAFNHGNTLPIDPANYTRVLRGCIAQVNFTLSHKVLRRKIPVSFFTTTVDEIIVIQQHVPADLSPSKTWLASRFQIPKEVPVVQERVGTSSSNKRRRV